MSSKSGDQKERSTGGELMGNPGVAKIVDFGVFNTGKLKVAVDGGSNVSNQERAAGFGDENGFFRSFLADF